MTTSCGQVARPLMGTADCADMTLGDIVTDNARRYPDVPAYRLGDRTVTHAGLRDRAVRLVSAMVAVECWRVGDNRETHAPRHAGEMSVGGHILEPCQLSILATVFCGSFCAPEGCWHILSCATILTF